MTAAPISKVQIRAIHTIRRAKGIDDDTYHLMLKNLYGVESCKALSRRQASRLLGRLAGRPYTPGGGKAAGAPVQAGPGASPRRKAAAGGRRRAALPPGVAALATRAQRELIERLREEVGWDAEDGYGRWLLASFGLERVATLRQAQKVIEGLKGLKLHGHGAGEGE